MRPRDRCCACPPARKPGKAVLVWRAGRWTGEHVLGPLLAAAGWVVWVWFSGRSWRHHVTRRVVRREVRAAGNWAATVVAVALLWCPLVVATVLAVAGVSLIAAALTARHRAAIQPATDQPIRVTAQIGDPRPLSSGGR